MNAIPGSFLNKTTSVNPQSVLPLPVSMISENHPEFYVTTIVRCSIVVSVHMMDL